MEMPHHVLAAMDQFSDAVQNGCRGSTPNFEEAAKILRSMWYPLDAVRLVLVTRYREGSTIGDAELLQLAAWLGCFDESGEEYFA
jgi:hypothetical protein